MSDAIGLVQIIEASLLAAGKPLSVAQLGALFEDHERPSNTDIRAALNEVKERCEGRGYELAEVASGFRFQVREQLSPWVGRLWQERPQRYSRALLETLALVAYRQPITRGEIEEIRGVAVSTNIIRTLHERDWIRVVGHRDVPGRPAMYATTRQFLDYFNLKSLDQLPALADIRDLETLNAELGFGEPLLDTASEDSAESDAAEGEGVDKVVALDAGAAYEGGEAPDSSDAVEAQGSRDDARIIEDDQLLDHQMDAEESLSTHIDGDALESANGAPVEDSESLADVDPDPEAESPVGMNSAPSSDADSDFDANADSLTERSVNGQG